MPTDTRRQLVDSIKKYAAENLDEELGELKAGLLLDFCLAEVGAVVYNRARLRLQPTASRLCLANRSVVGPTLRVGGAEAQRYFQERTIDLDGVCHQPEFSYWPRSGGKKR